MAERIVLLVDINACFAAIEQQCNPYLRGRPVLVCGNPTSRTIVTAVSYEARSSGVKSGMPLGKALRLCPQAILIEGDRLKYIDTARRFQELLLRFSPQVEIFSIDEAFLELAPEEDALAIARKIKQQLRRRFGLICSIGLGPNKLVAKLAAAMEKPDGLVWIRQADIPRVFATLPISELCGIGPRITKRLQSLGIWTAGQLGSASRADLRAHFGVFWGEWLANMGQGIDPSPVVSCLIEPVVKSMGHSYTLPYDTSNLAEVRAHLLRLSLMVGRRLRADGYAGRTLRLTVRTADFTTICRHQTFPRWLYHGQQICQGAWSIFERLPWRGPIRMLGVAVTNLAKGASQHELFFDNKKSRSLEQAEDAVLDRFGEFTLKPAALLLLQAKLPHKEKKWSTLEPAASRSLAGARRFILTR